MSEIPGFGPVPQEGVSIKSVTFDKKSLGFNLGLPFISI